MSELAQGVREGNRSSLGRAITLIESTAPRHRRDAESLLTELLVGGGKSIRVGVTGLPGVGKSTFIESLGTLLTGRGHRVAVLAVDPSSTKSGGSILGDKTRMLRLSVDDKAFIRPSPSAGTLGGVARKTRETMMVCEAAGYDVVLVETVGVGQSETAVASMTDFFVVLLLPGAGDELQGIKKGLLELADVLAINQADGPNKAGAERTASQYESALALLGTNHEPDHSPRVFTCSALHEEGLVEIWDSILSLHSRSERDGSLSQKRENQRLSWMEDLIEQGLRDSFRRNPNVRKAWDALRKDVCKGAVAPSVAAASVLRAFGIEEPSVDGEI